MAMAQDDLDEYTRLREQAEEAFEGLARLARQAGVGGRFSAYCSGHVEGWMEDDGRGNFHLGEIEEAIKDQMAVCYVNADGDQFYVTKGEGDLLVIHPENEDYLTGENDEGEIVTNEDGYWVATQDDIDGYDWEKEDEI